MRFDHPIYAFRNGNIVGIDDDNVVSGLACNCICPQCGGRLVAKKGQKVIHHFAHHVKQDCTYGYQTSLHLLAKEILDEADEMYVPDISVKYENTNRCNVVVSKGKYIHIDKVMLEKKFDDVIPDVTIESGGHKLYVEIYVTHKVDDVKLKKIQEQDVSTLEIDLSDIDRLITKEELKEILLGPCKEKRWIYSKLGKKIHDDNIALADRIICRSGRAENCPLLQRCFRGRYYANIIDDCIYCQYCVGMEHDRLLCLGRKQNAVCNCKNVKEPKNVAGPVSICLCSGYLSVDINAFSSLEFRQFVKSSSNMIWEAKYNKYNSKVQFILKCYYADMNELLGILEVFNRYFHGYVIHGYRSREEYENLMEIIEKHNN